MHSEDKKDTLHGWIKRGVAATATGQHTGSQQSVLVQTLEGNLTDKPISWLLQAAQHYEATGHMLVGSKACNIGVQFGLGRAVHAFSPFCTGVEALMDLFIWRDGKVKFDEGKQPNVVSIQEGIEELVWRGEAYIANLAFLEQHGINEMSFLLRPSGRLADGELEERLAGGQSIDPALQSEFYSSIYGTRNLKDAAERLALQHSQWVSITANLLKLGLLVGPDGRSLKAPEPRRMPDYPALSPYVLQQEDQIPDQLQPPDLAPASELDALPQESAGTPLQMIKMGVPEEIITLDPAHIDLVRSILSQPETGIFRSEALQFFLDREFAKAYRFRTALSLVLFCVKLTAYAEPYMSAAAAAALTGSIGQIKRDVDMFGHFGDGAFAILLPNIESDQACCLVDRISETLPLLDPGLSQYQPSLHFGIASVPKDATELSALVRAAQLAMFGAVNGNLLRVEAGELRFVS